MLEKPWYASKTIIGGLIALIAGLLSANAGIVIDENSQNCLTDLVASQNFDRWLSLFGSLGAVVSIYGRLTADTTITPLRKGPLERPRISRKKRE